MKNEEFSWTDDKKIEIALASSFIRKPSFHELYDFQTDEEKVETKRRTKYEDAVKALMVRHRPTLFISLCFRKVWKGHNRKGYLYFAKDTDHDKGEKLLKHWVCGIYREILGRDWSRRHHQIEQIALQYTSIPERTRGSGRLHYHLLVGINPAYESQFNKIAQKVWLKVIGERAEDLTFQERSIFFLQKLINEQQGGTNGLVDYLTKQIRQHSQIFERMQFQHDVEPICN